MAYLKSGMTLPPPKVTLLVTMFMLRCRYSSEIAGTIIVQCIPILRPVIREIHTTTISRKLRSTTDNQHTDLESKLSRDRSSVESSHLPLQEKQAEAHKALHSVSPPFDLSNKPLPHLPKSDWEKGDALTIDSPLSSKSFDTERDYILSPDRVVETGQGGMGLSPPPHRPEGSVQGM
jgi:hypothetical protein